MLCLEHCTKILSHLLPRGTGEVGLPVYRAPLGCPTMGTDSRVRPYVLAHPAGQTCREGRPSHPLRLSRDRVLPCDAYLENAWVAERESS